MSWGTHHQQAVEVEQWRQGCRLGPTIPDSLPWTCVHTATCVHTDTRITHRSMPFVFRLPSLPGKCLEAWTDTPGPRGSPGQRHLGQRVSRQVGSSFAVKAPRLRGVNPAHGPGLIWARLDSPS